MLFGTKIVKMPKMNKTNKQTNKKRLFVTKGNT